MTKALAIFLILLSTGLFAEEPINSTLCARILTSQYVAVDQVTVTGTKFQTIQNNLALNPRLLNEMAKPGRSVLTVGEGISELLPTLIEIQIPTQALDIWYHSKIPYIETAPYTQHQGLKAMAEFQKKYSPYLIRGSALDMPLENETKDFILSHLLANNLHIGEQLRFFSETVRVLKVGGQARILLTPQRTPDQPFPTQILIIDFLAKNYGEAVQASIDTGLLKIQKIESTKTNLKPEIEHDPKVRYPDLPAGAKLNKAERKEFQKLPSIPLQAQ